MIPLWARILLLLKKKPKRSTGTERKIKNLKKDETDDRDYKVTSTLIGKALVSLFPKNSLKEYCPPVKNQGSIGSCGSMAWTTAIEIRLKVKESDHYTELSELFHYYHVRGIYGGYPEDSGQSLRDGAKVLQKIGTCPEKMWPYNESKWNSSPSSLANSMARFWKIKEYARCYTVEHIKESIAVGYPVVFGMKTFPDFDKGIKTHFEVPKTFDMGGHAVTIIGYDDDLQQFEIVNSWGTNWGNKGFATMSYECVEKVMLDAWTLNV